MALSYSIVSSEGHRTGTGMLALIGHCLRLHGEDCTGFSIGQAALGREVELVLVAVAVLITLFELNIAIERVEGAPVATSMKPASCKRSNCDRMRMAAGAGAAWRGC